MFGIKHSIIDQSLYSLHDMAESQLPLFVQQLKDCDEADTDGKEELKNKIVYFKKELTDFFTDIEKQRTEKFQFSVEELYSMYGQYESRFLSIEFHKFSEAASKYGRQIRGAIIYSKKERENLEEVIKQVEIPRTNGLVKLEVSEDLGFDKEKVGELLDVGFLSGDIYQILTVNLPQKKSYGVAGKKDIPNTIKIDFDPTGFDPYKMHQVLLIKRINKGGALLDFEWEKLAGYTCYYEPSAAVILNEKIFDADGKKYNNVRHAELEAKCFNVDIKAEELVELNHLLKERKDSRIQKIVKEIKSSTNKKFEAFENDYPLIYKELMESTINFDDETLVHWNLVKPIYWDYESFLHIYLRHCDELAIEGHFDIKTKFQYSKKDIKRILVIGIENLSEIINEKLSQGKDFRIYGDKSLYFNGNHYSLHIQANGRVAAFHPYEEPK